MEVVDVTQALDQLVRNNRKGASQANKLLPRSQNQRTSEPANQVLRAASPAQCQWSPLIIARLRLSQWWMHVGPTTPRTLNRNQEPRVNFPGRSDAAVSLKRTCGPSLSSLLISSFQFLFNSFFHQFELFASSIAQRRHQTLSSTSCMATVHQKSPRTQNALVLSQTRITTTTSKKSGRSVSRHNNPSIVSGNGSRTASSTRRWLSYLSTLCHHQPVLTGRTSW